MDETGVISEEEDIDQKLIQENQQVMPYPAGDHKDAWNRQVSITNIKIKHI